MTSCGITGIERSEPKPYGKDKKKKLNKTQFIAVWVNKRIPSSSKMHMKPWPRGCAHLTHTTTAHFAL